VSVGSRDSLVDIVTVYGLHGLGSVPDRRKIFYPTAFRPVKRHNESHVQWLPGALSSGVKRRGCEIDYLCTSSVKVKKGGGVPPHPQAFS
jgi:hypothetical protein